MRDGFIIHEKTLKQMSRLDPEDVQYLMACLSDYYYTGEVDIDEVEEISVAVAVILDDAIERMKADSEAYEKSVEQRRQAANKRWHNDSDAMRDDATACESMREPCESHAKNAVSVSVSDSVIKENYPTDSKRKVFVRPTVEEVSAYCTERGNKVDPEAFVAFYDSKGWKVGNSPMKSWKAAVITWEKRTKPPSNRFQNFPQRTDQEHVDLVKKIIAMQ